MFKLKLFFLSFSLSFFLLNLLSLSFADDDWNTLTYTTYYPAIYGIYNESQSNKLAIGDINVDGQFTTTDQPQANGQIYAARSIILKPQSPLPSSNAVTGEVAYNNSDKKLYSYDGFAWAALGGSTSSGVTMMSGLSASTSLANASQYCYNLSAPAEAAMNGDTTTTYTDWRLPTPAEAITFMSAITDINFIWTIAGCHAKSPGTWIILRLSDGFWSNDSYVGPHSARCVR